VPQASPATIDIADFTSDVIRQEASWANLARRGVEVFRAGEFSDDVVAALEDSVDKFGVGAA